MSDPSRAAPAGPPEGRIARLDRHALPDETWSALTTGAIVAPVAVSVLAVSGPGAVSCMQGLLTTDVAKPGDGAFLYGALLTPKGMIVVDGWSTRRGTTITYTVPTDLAERALAIFHRALPPRLARVRDITADLAVFRLAGPRALATAQAAGLVTPAAGSAGDSADGLDVARPADVSPFSLQLATPARDAARVIDRLRTAGVVLGDAPALEAARILAGWPRVGIETDDKTIPQEVRFDEIGGVSYTKGCYTGQETVSRVHFRGHANRVLRGVRFDDAPEAGRAAVSRGDRDVGRVTSVLWTPGDTWLGLAVVRREVDVGAVVRAAGQDARVVDLPFAWPVPARR
jgi:tRNA-modifying protein YgfZ